MSLQKLGADKASLERDFEAVKVTYRPGAPAYQEAESRLEKIKQRIRDQVAVHLGGIRNEYELAVSNERNLRADIRQTEQQAFQAGVATSKYDVARTDAATTKAMYDVIAKTLNEVSVNSELVANNIAVLDHAIPPIYPVAPNKKLNLVLGVLIGSFLGIARRRSSSTTWTTRSTVRRTSSDSCSSTPWRSFRSFDRAQVELRGAQGGLPDLEDRADLPQQESRAQDRALDEHRAAGREVLDDGAARTRPRLAPATGCCSSTAICAVPTQHIHLGLHARQRAHGFPRGPAAVP